jgi:4-hydroxy-tetrahydrodipicolinate synthase
MNSGQECAIWSATPTPFLNSGELDIPALGNVVEQHLRLGVEGLFLAGTCGEGPFMTNDQRADLARQVRRLAGARLTLAVQVSDTSAARVQENMKRAQQAGADFAVIAPPWLERFANRDFLRRYFLESIENAPLPVGVYVIKPAAGTPLDLSLWAELAAHPRVKLVKDSSGDKEYCRSLAAIRDARNDMLLLTGNEFDTLSAVRAGYDGALLGTGILIGGMIRRALDALKAGDRTIADGWQARSNAFLYDLFGQDLHLWLGGLKYALRQLGIFNTEYMHLSFALDDQDRRHIDEALAREHDKIGGAQ